MTICRVVYKNKNGYDAKFYAGSSKECIEAFAQDRARGRFFDVQDVEGRTLDLVISHSAFRTIPAKYNKEAVNV